MVLPGPLVALFDATDLARAAVGLAQAALTKTKCSPEPSSEHNSDSQLSGALDLARQRRVKVSDELERWAGGNAKPEVARNEIGKLMKAFGPLGTNGVRSVVQRVGLGSAVAQFNRGNASGRRTENQLGGGGAGP